MKRESRTVDQSHQADFRTLQHRERWRSAGRGHETRGAKWNIFRDWDKSGTTDRDRGDGRSPIARFIEERLEAPPGFEPGGEDLQTSALPLGDGASVGEGLTR